MTDRMMEIPISLRVEDVCESCRREFVRARGLPAICPSCGSENPRNDARLESMMLTAPTEKAVKPTPKRKPSRRRK